MTASSVRVARDGEVALLTLARPHMLNALTLDVIADINAALDEMAAWAPRCLVLTGEGRAFCAGGDLTAHRDRPADTPPFDLGEALSRYFHPLLNRLLHLPMPIVAAVNGPAAGAGLPLALAADFVIAGRSAFFECGFMRIALAPDMGADWFLPRLIGRARTHAMMMLDERVPAERAEAWGLIYKCVNDADLDREARALAARLAQAPTRALCGVRQSVLAACGGSLNAALDNEIEPQRTRGYSVDFAEGIAAFFEKRQPRFTDR